MARVGILTFHYTNNHGAVLQAYGLSKAIEAMGYCVQVLDYRPLTARRFFGNWPRHPARFVSSAMFRGRFRWFREHYLPLSARTYWTLEDLQLHPPDVDYVVCGSDQVWNIASRRGFDPVFFLEFLDESGPRRIAYAATFGYAQEFGDYRQRIGNLLSKFDHLSVRDVNSQNMVRELIGRAPMHVLDPSFLADYGPVTARRTFRYPYVFVYCSGEADFSMHAVRVLWQRLKMPVISISTSFGVAKVVISAGPLQWLSLMRYADFVCTNSFHGTCFSLIYQKQFVVLPTTKGQSRLEDILKSVGLSNRLVSNDDELKRCLTSPIDYSIVSERLREARLRSNAFLQEALK